MNYGLSLTDKSPEDQFEIIKRPWPENNFPFTQDAVPVLIKAKGKIIPQWTLDKYGLCDVLPLSFPVSVATKEKNDRANHRWALQDYGYRHFRLLIKNAEMFWNKIKKKKKKKKSRTIALYMAAWGKYYSKYVAQLKS